MLATCLKWISASCALCHTLPCAIRCQSTHSAQKHIQSALCRLLLYMLLVWMCHKPGLIVLHGAGPTLKCMLQWITLSLPCAHHSLPLVVPCAHHGVVAPDEGTLAPVDSNLLASCLSDHSNAQRLLCASASCYSVTCLTNDSELRSLAHSLHSQSTRTSECERARVALGPLSES